MAPEEEKAHAERVAAASPVPALPVEESRAAASAGLDPRRVGENMARRGLALLAVYLVVYLIWFEPAILNAIGLDFNNVPAARIYTVIVVAGSLLLAWIISRAMGVEPSVGSRRRAT